MPLPKLESPRAWINMTQEERDRFVSLYKGGARYKDISISLRISKYKVGMLRDFLKLEKRNPTVQLPLAKILYSYATLGMSLTEIAGHLGVSRPTVARAVKSRGLDIRRRKPVKKCAERRAEIYHRHQNGERVVDIAASLRLSPRTVLRRIREVIYSTA